ncbi:uncharacterized protein LOC120123033 [Hibiscus syriacus]|uniref:uncharacterized protein LOC120123033 n=1 Tax=Hibiscus syriacus TaxID=106335 RepID=UPI0019240D12|nr:uncharacterized protein LOC120123033 [Hibiscus syriacus]
MAWIRLPGLPVTLYKRSFIEAIGNQVGFVIKIDFQSDSGCRGRFARLAVSLNLHRPLVSELLINGRLQIIEYESLPTVCFHCGYSHHKYICPQLLAQKNVQPMTEVPPEQPLTSDKSASDEAFGPWMLENQSKSKVTEAESTISSSALPLNAESRPLTEPMSTPIDKNKLKDKTPTNPKKTPTVPNDPKKQVHLGGKPVKLHAPSKAPMQGSHNAVNGASSSNLPRLNSTENLDPNKHHVVKLIDGDNPRTPTEALVPPAIGKETETMIE